MTVEGALVGLVQAPAAERARRPDHRRHIDVEIHGDNPEARADEALGAVALLLEEIDGLREAAEALAPGDWRVQVRGAASYPGLFLEGLEFDDDGLTRVLFDYHGMEVLSLELHADVRRNVRFE